MLSRQPNNVVGCYVIIQARFFDNGGSFAKRTSDMNCRITDKIVARLALAGLCYSALTAFAVPDVRFMEETHSDLDAVRKWAEITTDAAEDEIDGIDFKFEPVPVGTDGGWTMPGHWPLLSRKKSDFEPLKGKAKLNGEVIARFRSVKIPVILIGGDAASKRTMCDILGVNTLANGRRTPILFTSPAAKRNPSLIANGELLGDVALRLMLQRIAYPEHPPCELYLDIPGEPAKTLRRSKKGKSQ